MSKGKWCRRRLSCNDNGGSRDLIIALAYRLLCLFLKKGFLKFFIPFGVGHLFSVKKKKVFRFSAMVFLFYFSIAFFMTLLLVISGGIVHTRVYLSTLFLRQS